jgi:hypothetical protein
MFASDLTDERDAPLGHDEIDLLVPHAFDPVKPDRCGAGEAHGRGRDVQAPVVDGGDLEITETGFLFEIGSSFGDEPQVLALLDALGLEAFFVD